MSTTPGNAMSTTPSKSAKLHTDAFWDALVRRGVTPEQAAPHIPDLSEFDIAAEMIKARRRLDEQAQEQAEENEGDDGDAPLFMQGQSRWGYCPRVYRGVR